MNVYRLPSLFALFLFAFSATSSAQSTAFAGGNEAYASAMTTRPAAASSNASTPYHFHKKLPQMFSGYAIEIAATNRFPLDRTNPIFRQFGNIYSEKLTEGGYSYLILGKFSSKDSALHFVQTIIKPKVEEARLFEYKDGIRKVIRD